MSDVELRLVADVDDAVKGVAGFRKEYADLVKEVAKPLKQVNAFRDLEQSLEGVEKESRAARERVRDLGNELARTASPSKELTNSYRDAVTELRRLERAETTAQARLAARRRELQAAGIDTSNLAAEQRRLSDELSKNVAAGRADADLRNAQKALGVGGIEQAQRRLVQLREQYRLVTAEGNLSAKERGEAEATYRASVTRTLELLRQLRAASAVPPGRAEVARQIQQEAAATAALTAQASALDAQRALGVGRIAAEQQALVKLREQYRLIQADGTLSARQRSEAEASYRRQVGETLGRLRDMRAAIAQQDSQEQRAAAAAIQRHTAARASLAQLAQAQREARLAAVETARTDLGVNRYRALQVEVARVRQQYELLKGSGRLTANELAIAQRNMTQRIREAQRAMREMNAEQSRARAGGGVSGLLAPVGTAYGAFRAVSGVTRQTDQWVELTDRIKLASTSQQEYEKGLESLRAMSDRTFTTMTNNAEVYIGSLSQLRERGFSSADALRFTETLGLGLVASAAKGERATQVINNFNSALQDGVLRGDAFNSMVRVAPALADAMARGLGKTREELAAMAKAGELTTDVFVPALISQMDRLGEAVDNMTITGGDGFVRVMNAWQEAVGKADLKPFTDALNQLASTLREPAVAEAITTISSLILKLAAVAISSFSDLAAVGQDIGVFVAKLMGSTDALSDIERQIASVDRALSGWGVGDLIARAIYSEEELKNRRSMLEGERQKIIESLTGMNAEVEFLTEVAAAAAEAARDGQLASYRSYIEQLKKLQGEQVKAAESTAKKLVAAEKKALGDLQKVRDERLAIEQRYEQAIADLSRGPKGDQNYLTALNLRQSAEQALANGDIAGAQKQAQEALKVIRELVEAGDLGMTVGIKDFIRSLGEIELEANSIAESNAEDKLADIRYEMQALKDQAKELKDMPVSVMTDEASLEKVRSAIETLVAQLNQKEVVIPVRVVSPEGSIIKDLVAPQDTVIRDLQVPKFAGGGVARGPGTGTSDSILARISNGEGIINARAVQHYGASLIHQLNALRVPKFATGGVMGNIPVPSIPALAPVLQQQLTGGGGGGADQDWGSMLIDLGNGPAPIRMPRSTAESLRREALKRGSPGRAR